VGTLPCLWSGYCGCRTLGGNWWSKCHSVENSRGRDGHGPQAGRSLKGGWTSGSLPGPEAGRRPGAAWTGGSRRIPAAYARGAQTAEHDLDAGDIEAVPFS
jgi:hypothetical protein